MGTVRCADESDAFFHAGVGEVALVAEEEGGGQAGGDGGDVVGDQLAGGAQREVVHGLRSQLFAGAALADD